VWGYELGRLLGVHAQQYDRNFDMGYVGGASARSMSKGWDVDKVMAFELREDGTVSRRCHVNSELVYKLNNGEIDKDEFAERYFETCEQGGCF
jgi:hypothetical protein